MGNEFGDLPIRFAEALAICTWLVARGGGCDAKKDVGGHFGSYCHVGESHRSPSPPKTFKLKLSIYFQFLPFNHDH